MNSTELKAFQFAVLHRASPTAGWAILAIHGRKVDAIAEQDAYLESERCLGEPDPEVRVVRWEPID